MGKLLLFIMLAGLLVEKKSFITSNTFWSICLAFNNLFVGSCKKLHITMIVSLLVHFNKIFGDPLKKKRESHLFLCTQDGLRFSLLTVHLSWRKKIFFLGG